MNRFNAAMATHFNSGGCRLIARARDTCRNRDVKIYAVPGHYDVVGITDGTDSWMAPTSTGPFFRTATGDVAAIMRKLEAGEPLPEVPDAPRRRAVLAEGAASEATVNAEQPRPRRALLSDPIPPSSTTKRRALL